MNMKVTKKLSVGQYGTKRFLEEYGEQLVCVRYRKDCEKPMRYTTVEIIVEESEITSGCLAQVGENLDEKNVWVKLDYHEHELRAEVQKAGAQWDKSNKLWKLLYVKACELQLEDRITKPRLKSFAP